MEKGKFTLLGRAFIHGSILAVTGLHIGAGSGVLAIGGMDNPVVRDPLTNKPYIPGSSLRGKMRSLSERAQGLPSTFGKDVRIHVCQTLDKYRSCDVCHVFGVPAQSWSNQTRLIVRDVPISEDSAKLLDSLSTDMPYTEVKYEVAIDRITSQANPRPVERVPAGTIFAPMEMSFAFYEPKDIERFRLVFRAMQLLEEDYLGGHGSRGSGNVKFENLSISCRAGDDWNEIPHWSPKADGSAFELSDLTGRTDAMENLERWLSSRLHLG